MSENIDLERRIERIENELDIDPYTERFKERVQSYRFPEGAFDRFEKDGRIAVIELTAMKLDPRGLKDIEDAFGEYTVDLEEKELHLYE